MSFLFNFYRLGIATLFKRKQIMEKHFKDAVDLLIEEQIHLTDVVEYGVSWTDLGAGKAMLPSAGRNQNNLPLARRKPPTILSLPY
jgi:mannose-1-phosphate guanylyltransferase